MQKGFWADLKKPIIVLAPLANVTDVAFRRIIAKYSKPHGPDIMWTEFVSCDGLVSEGREKLMIDLRFTEKERPIVAQFFGSKSENFRKCAALAGKMGFDGIDINMGCPDRAVEKQGAGAALCKTPELAREIIRAAKSGAGDLPVSVKIRLGYNRDELKDWLPALLAEQPAAITIHARTRKEMSKVPARWNRVADAVQIRDRLGSKTLILGNGDISDAFEARQKAAETGCDGVMIGRGIFGKPWLFNENVKDVRLEKRMEIMLEHTLLFEKLFGGIKNFDTMKKHYKAYIADFPGAREFRADLMETKSVEEAVQKVIKKFPKVQLPQLTQ